MEIKVKEARLNMFRGEIVDISKNFGDGAAKKGKEEDLREYSWML